MAIASSRLYNERILTVIPKYSGVAAMTQTHSDARDSQRLDELRRYLQGAGYADYSVEHLCVASRQFLEYLHERGIAIEAVQPAQVVMYMRRRLREYRRSHGRMPQNRRGWRTWCTDG